MVRTFLIADVRGYTSFTHAHGDEEAGRIAARFADLVREAVAAWAASGFDENGDLTPPTISVFQVTAQGRGADAPDFYGGADFDRVVRVPPELIRP